MGISSPLCVYCGECWILSGLALLISCVEWMRNMCFKTGILFSKVVINLETLPLSTNLTSTAACGFVISPPALIELYSEIIMSLANADI